MKPKVAIPSSLLLMLVAAPFLYRSYRIHMLPDIGDPFDVDAFGTIDIPNEENAFLDYQEAKNLLVPFKYSDTDPGYRSRAKIMEEEVEKGWSGASDNLRKWLDDNRTALRHWRKGTEKSDAVFHQPKDLTQETVLPVQGEMHELSWLAILEGGRLVEAGDYQAAWRWYRAVYRSSRQCGRYGGIVERMIGILILKKSAKAIEKWSRNPQVAAEQLKRASQDLQSIYRITAPASSALKAEYIMILDAFEDAYDDGYVREELEKVPEILRGTALYFSGEPELSIRVARQFWKNQLSHIDKPLHKRPPRTLYGFDALFEATAPFENSRDASNEEIDKALQQSILGRLLLPATMQFDEAIRREQVRHRALLVCLAAQRYQRENGEFPETIEDLLNVYLDEIPLDPHDPTGGPLKYRRNSDGFTVWGIGANQFDDGGRIGRDTELDDFGYYIGPEDKTQ